MATKLQHTFSKEERLCSRKTIEALFVKGKSYTVHPYKVIWMTVEEKKKYPVQVVVSVPKRTFRKAHIRNKIRRRIKEAYRKHKLLLYDFLSGKNTQCALAIVYTAKEVKEYAEIETKLVVTLQHFSREYETHTE